MMPASDTPAASLSTLNVDSLSVVIDDSCILSNINFQLQSGRLVALLGPSGSGKSTLMKCLLGLRKPSRGKISFDQQNIESAGPVGYVPQDDYVHPNLTVIQELDYAAQLRLPGSSAEERAVILNAVLHKVDLLGRKNLRIRKLSGGQRKRVSVALELITSPKTLVLDEPTSGLDPGLESKMMALFAELAHTGRTVLVATHAMESIMCCDEVLLLMEGRLIFHGTPPAALTHFKSESFVDIFKQLDKQSSTQWANNFSRLTNS